jgi:hypothetical protein
MSISIRRSSICRPLCIRFQQQAACPAGNEGSPVVRRRREDDLFRTLLMGILALAALGAVLGAVFFVGLARLRWADRSGPIAPAPAATSPPAATVPATQPAVAPVPDPLPAVSIESIELPAERARLGSNLKLDKDTSSDRPHSHHRPGSPPDPPPALRQAITNFHEEGDVAEWATTIARPGLYEVDLVYAAQGPKDKSEGCVLTVGDQDLHADTLSTRGRESYQVLTVGNLTLPPGNLTVRFHLAEKSHGVVLRLRSIRLIPAA